MIKGVDAWHLLVSSFLRLSLGSQVVSFSFLSFSFLLFQLDSVAFLTILLVSQALYLWR